MLTFKQLSTPTTVAQATEMGRAFLAGQGFSSNDWESGSVQLTFLMLFAWLYSAMTYMIAALLSGGYNDTAVGDFLDHLSDSNFDNQRADVQTARHRMAFTCSSAAGPYTPTKGSIVVSDGSHTFRLVEDLANLPDYPIVPIPSGGTVYMVCEAEVGGAIAGNVANGTITRMVTTLAGVTCSNPAFGTSGRSLLRSGVDRELDPRLQNRNRTKWGTLSVENPRIAVINLALNASPSILKAAVDDGNPRGPGSVDVWISADLGPLSPGGTEVQILQAILDRRFMGNGYLYPDGTTKRALARSAPAQEIAPRGVLYYDPNYELAVVEKNVADSFNALLSRAPLGGYDYSPGPTSVLAVGDIVASLESAEGVGLSELTYPTSDIPVEAWAVLTPNLTGIAYVARSSS